jgi:hypothetical protein
MKIRQLGKNGPTEITLSADDLNRINEVVPVGATAGQRYPETAMRGVQK